MSAEPNGSELQATEPKVAESKVKVGPTDQMPDGFQGAIEVGGVSVLVVNYQGQFYALRNNCTHKDFPLLGGEVTDGRITCEKHGGKFELATGKAKTLPAVKPVQVYGTVIENGVLYVQPL